MSRPRLAAVVFDMDGLMLDTERLYRSAWRRAAGDFGLEIDDGLYHRLIGRSTRDAASLLAGVLGPDLPLPAFHARWLECWREEAARVGITPKPGLERVLATVERLGLRKAVATSTERKDALFSLRRAAIAGRFDAIVTGDDVERGKPAPEIFLAAARALGTVPPACLALEDSDAGIGAAAAAGMLAVMVPDMKPPSPAARAAAFRVLDSLEQVPGLLRDLGLETTGR